MLLLLFGSGSGSNGGSRGISISGAVSDDVCSDGGAGVRNGVCTCDCDGGGGGGDGRSNGLSGVSGSNCGDGGGGEMKNPETNILYKNLRNLNMLRK